MSKKERKYGTFVHGIGASEHLDSSGERIKIEGIDITSLTRDGTLNYEHKSDTSSQIVGKIIEAKKIFKRSDCDNDHQRYFWDKVNMPYLYIAGELFDAVGHSGAQDVAAHLRYDAQGHINKEAKNVVNFSIEGQRLEHRGNTIDKCIARKITITVTPCNKVAGAEIKKDPRNDTEKTTEDFSFIQDLMMNEQHGSSCQIIKGEIPFLQSNIKSEPTNMKYPKPWAPKRTFTPDTAPAKIKVGDRINHTKPKPPPKPGQYGKVIIKNKEKDKKMTVSTKEMVEEHKKLVNVLESPSHKDDKKEAKKQKKELKEYKTKAKITKAKVDEKLPPEQREYARQARREVSGPGYTQEQAKARAKTRQKMKLNQFDSNIRKAIVASCGMGAPSTSTQGDALQKEKMIKTAMVDLANNAFKNMKKKEELVNFLTNRLPKLKKHEILALAKAVSYVHEKKQESKLKKLTKA